MIEDFKHMKWLPLAGGALLCVLGLTALVWPGRVAKILPLCIGAAILGLGLCEVASGFLAKSFLPEYIPGMRKLQGFVNVAVGLVFLLNRTLSLMFIAVVLGVWAVADFEDASQKVESSAENHPIPSSACYLIALPHPQAAAKNPYIYFFCGISRPAAP